MTDFVSVTVQDTAPIAVTVPTDDGTTVAVTVSTPAVIAPVVTTGGSGGGTGGAVSSVNGQTGDVVLTATSVGADTPFARDTAITTAVNALVNAAPGLLDTLKELADAIGDDPNFAATLATEIAAKVDAAALAAVSFSGNYNDLTGLPLLDFVRLSDAAPINDTTPSATNVYSSSEVESRVGTRVAKSGDTMSGDLAMGGHRVTGLADPSASQDAATKAWTSAQITALVNGAPGILDTLGEIATQLQSDESAAAVLATAITNEVTRATNAEATKAPVTTTTIDLVDRTNNTTETVPAGFTTNCGTAGVTKTAPAVAGTVGTPPLRFAVKNTSSGSITLSYPDQTGSAQSLTLLTGETRTFRQKSTSGWGVESGAIALATLDARYAAAGAALPESQVTSLVADLATNRRRAAPNLLRTGAIAETLDRRALNSAAVTPAAGTLRLAALQLIAGDVVTNIVFAVGTIAAGTPTHNFAALLDSSGNVLAMSADKTTTAMPASAEFIYAMTSPYTVTASGLYYIGMSITASTQPSLVGGGFSNYVTALGPALNATISGQTTPPSVGAALGAPTASAALIPWGYVS